MRRFFLTLLSVDQKARIRSVLDATSLKLAVFFSASRWSATLYYSLFSGQFRREMQAVLAGRVAYRRSLHQVGQSSALLRRNIHRLEKGLIMRPRRAVFASDYIAETVAVYEKAVIQSSLCRDELKWASDVLQQYFSVVQDNVVIAKARQQFAACRHHYQGNSTSDVTLGAASVPYPHQQLPQPGVTFGQLTQLFQRRRSVRWFLQQEVDPALIHQAVNIASLAPSACNRQPYRFDLLSLPADAAKVARLAMGTTGFADQIPSLIAVIGDLSCYPAERDRHVIYIDASLASMQLMLALETLGLSTCPINWPDIEQREQAIAKELDLAPYERVVMLMAIGYADPAGGIPYSQKKTDELLLRQRKL